jgi:hypothetical protein
MSGLGDDCTASENPRTAVVGVPVQPVLSQSSAQGPQNRALPHGKQQRHKELTTPRDDKASAFVEYGDFRGSESAFIAHLGHQQESNRQDARERREERIFGLVEKLVDFVFRFAERAWTALFIFFVVAFVVILSKLFGFDPLSFLSALRSWF